jgi:hypothetical protein
MWYKSVSVSRRYFAFTLRVIISLTTHIHLLPKTNERAKVDKHGERTREREREREREMSKKKDRKGIYTQIVGSIFLSFGCTNVSIWYLFRVDPTADNIDHVPSRVNK